MDTSPADEEQEQPFYKMDITAAKDREKQEQPFYEMKVASADEKNEEQIFYDMDDNQLRQPTSDNVYSGLDAEFVAAQDAVCMRNRAREGSRDHWAEWTLYIREYFQQDSDAAMGLEECYPDNGVVMALLEDRFFWHWVCRYWERNADLPHTLSEAVTYGILFGTSSEYMESHGFATYREFFSSTLDALEAMPNTTESLQNSGYRHYTSLSLSGRTLSENDVKAMANLFPYLRGVENLHHSRCGLSAKAAKSLARQLHLLHALNALVLSKNKIGDDGLEAISETFSHLKELTTFDVVDNSITNVGGRALAKRLVHLQALQKILLGRNELALSLSSLAKAFVNMTRLQYVHMWPITCRADSFRMAAQQVHDAVHTLEGQVGSVGSVLLYDASTGSTGGTWESDTAWQRVEQKLTAGVHISNGQIKMSLKINLLEE
ncbi:NLRC3 [Branchiostoma lanceolatum]|uniref:NLRC3 protein n=1 Tax=Branchiostoma lanceolatum TaxID=7740 RepID=A0A8J9YQX5_BRALA|nr:NLRC3 [Branchiostoma lanceolatum]